MMMDREIKRSQAAISIEDLLIWAFRDECARLEFGESAAEQAGMTRQGGGPEYRLMMQAQLGCRPDGGGSSDPHPDADLVADAVAHLPVGHGGRAMAVQIAELARAGLRPDWMRGVVQRVSPAKTRINRHGLRSETADAAALGVEGWPHQSRRGRKGNLIVEPVLFSPVVIRPSGQEIARARRFYLNWWGALLELQSTFRLYSSLSQWSVATDMPVMSPWVEKTA